ncbi:MAG TPA: type II secretion system F family protein, partial [Nitrospirota bacterium]
MEILIGLGVFLLTLLVMQQGYSFIQKLYKPEQRKVQRRLKTLSESQGSEAVDIVKKKRLSEIPWLDAVLLRASFVQRLERLHTQAATPRPLGFFMVLSALLFFAGILFLSAALKINFFASLISSTMTALSPFFYLSYKRKKRMEKFERQLPEALELVARALKAGHAFTGGLRMVAEEFGEPVGAEFGKTLDEINFGIGAAEALTNMTRRVDCDDLKFFAVSVIIQRETGGNLAEILESLGHLIRERFKFHGRVRVLS